jgi:hypothetical protein
VHLLKDSGLISYLCSLFVLELYAHILGAGSLIGLVRLPGTPIFYLCAPVLSGLRIVSRRSIITKYMDTWKPTVFVYLVVIENQVTICKPLSIDVNK